MIKFYSFVLLFVISNAALAQERLDTIALTKVVIEASPINNSVGKNAFKINNSFTSVFANRSLADILQQSGWMHVRSAGSGTLATLHLRGASGQQSPIIWQNVALNSPMNGNFDLNLVPVAFFDEIDLETGSNSALWGSGSMGGSLHLGKINHLKNGFNSSFDVRLSSLGNQSLDTKIAYKAKRYWVDFRFHSAKEANRFRFQNKALFDEPWQWQERANGTHLGGMIRAEVEVSNSQSLDISAWLQMSNRQLPQAMTASYSQQTQQDSLARFVINHKFKKEKWVINSKIYHFNERIVFVDSALFLADRSRSINTGFEVKLDYQIKKNHFLQINANHMRLLGEVNSHLSTKTDFQLNQQHRFGYSLGYVFKIATKTTINAALRLEHINQFTSPLTPFTRIDYKTNRNWIWHLQFASSFRFPTLNDLFWKPGGNPNLKPELGNSWQIGFLSNPRGNKLVWQIENQLFHNQFTNLIQWVPTNGNFWTPINQNKVVTTGVEVAGKIVSKGIKWQKGVELRFGYTLHRLQTANNKPIDWLFYMPRTTAASSIFCSFKGARFTFAHQYTGKRSTLADASSFLPGFGVSQFRFDFKTRFCKSYFTEIGFEMQNIFNVQYQVIEWRAMPGRFVQCNLKFNLQ